MKNVAPPVVTTLFPRSDRASVEAVLETHRTVLMSQMLMNMLEAVPDFALVLNEERQIVAANKLVLNAFSPTDMDHLLGKRPGEAMGCIFSADTPAGCGAGDHCSTCGAVISLLKSKESCSRTAYECRLTITPEEPVSLDLKVIATPVVIDGKALTFCVMKDISDEKRRLVLEHVFFHDVINTAGGIHGIASLLSETPELDESRETEYKQWMLTLTETLIDEINHQRKLLAAERGDFKPLLGLVSVPALLGDIHALYQHHNVAEGRILILEDVAECTIISDPSILRRILGNLVKNALEATPRGGTVAISTLESAEHISFVVRNPGVMPREVQLQLFQRSFSTKGMQGRGIGTYSIKLFGERYLKGKIEFTSREPDGTTFTFTIPKHSLE